MRAAGAVIGTIASLVFASISYTCEKMKSARKMVLIPEAEYQTLSQPHTGLPLRPNRVYKSRSGTERSSVH